MGAAGIANDTAVVLYGEGIQFGVYAWCRRADRALIPKVLTLDPYDGPKSFTSKARPER